MCWWLPTSVNHKPLLNDSSDTETFGWRPTRPSIPKRLSWWEWRRWKQTYKTTHRNINGCSLLGDKGRIRKTRLEQGNTDGRGKQGRNRETAGQWEWEPTTAGITETQQITRQWLKKSLKQIQDWCGRRIELWGEQENTTKQTQDLRSSSGQKTSN